MKHLTFILLLPLFLLLAATTAAQPAAPAGTEPAPAAPAPTELSSAVQADPTEKPAATPESAAPGNDTERPDAAATATATADAASTDAAGSAAASQAAGTAPAAPPETTAISGTVATSAPAATAPAATAMPSPDPEIVQLKSDRGELRLEIAGYGITLGNRDADESKAAGNEAAAPSEKPEKKPLKRFHGCFGFTDWEIGIPLLVNTSYGPAWAGEGEFLETSTRKSFSFGYTLLSLRYMLDRNGHWWLSTGVRGNIYDIVLSGKQTIRYTDGMIHALELDPSTKKSKLSFTTLGIPLMLTCSVSDFRITLRASGNLYTSYRAVHKKPKEKYELRGVEPWSWNIGGAITYHKIGVSFDYALTPLFRSDVGPETHLFTFGICFGF
ncbi:hypothetical protein [uncultured Alistipes sp.]|uniref:hypothetical protein n=1 Tax=uncultured Alistipes sp. TaxID=538949 RepID=UPI0025D4BD6B|nr:hypothetical protein [uncultured Alistipes sp.]